MLSETVYYARESTLSKIRHKSNKFTARSLLETIPVTKLTENPSHVYMELILNQSNTK